MIFKPIRGVKTVEFGSKKTTVCKAERHADTVHEYADAFADPQVSHDNGDNRDKL